MKRIFIALFSALILLNSCSHNSKELEISEKMIEQSPDSAQKLLDKLQYNNLNDRDKAVFGLLTHRIRDKKNLPSSIDSLLRFSTNYFNTKNEKNNIAYCYYYIGKFYKEKLSFDKATTNYFKALDYVSESDITLKGKINYDIASVFAYQKNYLEAITKYKLAHEYFEKTKQNRLAANALISIGKTYTSLKNFKKAQTYFDNVIKNTTDLTVLGFALQNAGINHYYNKNYDQAVEKLTESLKYPYLKNNRAVQSYFLADSYFELSQKDSAKKYAHNAFKYQPDIVTKRECYRILTNIANIEGDVPGIKHNISLYQDCSDSLRKIDDQARGRDIELIHYTKKESFQKTTLNWLLVISSLIIITIIVLIYMRKQVKNNELLLESEEKQVQQKKESIQDTIERNRAALQLAINNKKAELMAGSKLNTPQAYRDMILKLYSEFIHIDDNRYFKSEIDARLNNLHSKLEHIYPDLKDKELKWACLHLLKFPNEDIIQLLDYNPEAYKKMKQRFARKIEVNAVANIEERLCDIMYQEK